MRRLPIVCVLAMVVAAAVSGCTGSSKPDPWERPNTAKATGASTPDVCGRIRSAITDDMKPIGTAMGSLVGYYVAKDSDDRDKAAGQVSDAVKAMAADINSAAADAADQKLKSAVATTVANINTLADDPTFVSAIASVDDIPTASNRLTDATAPIATACG
jgi:hypothetical protein